MLELQEGLLLLMGQVLVIMVLLGLGLWLVKTVFAHIAQRRNELRPRDDEPSALDAWSKDVF